MGTFPLAVAPSTLTPGTYLTVNLLAGQSSPGSTAGKCLLIGGKSSAGTITSDSQLVEAVGGADDVQTLLGPGTPGHLAAKALFAEHGIAQVDVVSPLEPGAGTAATQTVVFGGAVTSAMTIKIWVAGRLCEFVWGASVSTTVAGDLFANWVNGNGYDLPVIAVNNVGTVTLTAKVKGTWGNDVKLYRELVGGAGGTVTLTGAALSGGTGEWDIANVLSLVTGREYEYICLTTGNTDNITAAVTTAPGKLKTHMDTYDSGLNALLQQAVVGCTDTITNVKQGTNQHDFAPMQYVYCQAGQSLPAEFAGAECGARMREESIDPAVNRIEMAYRAMLYGCYNHIPDDLTEAEIEGLIGSGVTPIDYTAQGVPRPKRPVTTYFEDATGATDRRVLDTSRVTGTFAVARDLRTVLPREFANAKLSEDLPAGTRVPPGVVEIKEIREFIKSRIAGPNGWIDLGVVSKARWDDAVATGAFVVRVNPTDDCQCDIVVPVKIVPPLAKFSLVVQHTQ